jgi:ABC-2 type transport system ATP-binding protein
MALIIQNLSKTYPNGIKALSNINLSVPSGIFGLLGPADAGKTSLVRSIATLQKTDSGSIFYNDIDVINEKEKVCEILGYLPQDFNINLEINPEKFLDYLALLKGITNEKKRKHTVEFLLEKTNLTPYKKQKLSSFSIGMKQRFGIAQALLGNPELLLLDEPFVGLDLNEKKYFFKLLTEISQDRVVLFSTCFIEDVKELCKELAILNKGQIVFAGNQRDAINNIKDYVYEARPKNRDVETEFLKNGYQVISEKLHMGNPVLHIYSEEKLEQFKAIPADLEDVYFRFLASQTINS